MRDATTGGDMDNKDRKAIDSALRDLAAALRNKDGGAANSALAEAGKAINASGYEAQFRATFGQLSALVKEWRGLL